MTLTLNRVSQMFLFVAICGMAFFSCRSNSKSDNSNVQTVNPNDLILSPVVHDSLSMDQIEKIKKIQKAFSEVDSITLEETITIFKRDSDPDSEIEIWLAMLNVYEKIITKNPALDINRKKEVYRLLLLYTRGNEAEVKAKAGLKLLTDKEVSEIFGYCELEEKLGL